MGTADYSAALVFSVAGMLLTPAASAEAPDSRPTLQLEAKIPLGNVQGRIDHMALDLFRKRLVVAELGNDSIGIIDLDEGHVLRTIDGLKQPQGVVYVPSSDTVYVSNAGDGSVRLFRGSDYAPAGRIDLGDNADNIRLDPASNRVVIGYGNGALAVIDPANGTKVTEISLQAHPGSFQLDRTAGRTYVNVPRAREIAVVDIAAGKQITTWSMRSGGNFPMALDAQAQTVLVVFRNPPRLEALSMQDGATAARTETCGDADDLFLDSNRRRIYIACGEGFLDVLEAGTYERLARIPTIVGARTALFVPELDRLFLASRAMGAEPASIWVFRPVP